MTNAGKIMNNKWLPCRLVWLAHEDGGRKKRPPLDATHNYTAIAKLDSMWSMRLRNREIYSLNPYVEQAEIVFLFEDAYLEVDDNPSFSLCEGQRAVALVTFLVE